MTRAAIMRWLRWRFWDVEDSIVNLLDWQPRPAPQPPPRAAPSPKPKPPAPHYVEWSACGLGDSQTFSVEGVNADMLRRVFDHLGAGHLFEIKRP